MPARSQNPKTPSKNAARTFATPSSVVRTVGEDEISVMLNEVQTIATSLADEPDNEHSDVDVNRLQNDLTKAVSTQKKLLKLGQKVGAHGNPAQIVQDARLTEAVNVSTIKPIQAIKTSETVWAPRVFSRKLRTLVTLDCMEPEDITEHMEPTSMSSQHYLTFLDVYAMAIAPGLAPNLAVVHGACREPVVKKPIKTQKVEGTQKQKPPPKGKAESVKRLKASEMDAASDPTMEKVNELHHAIHTLYVDSGRKAVDVMSILIHPTSFQSSVEKFFCFSFLVKDAKVRMYLDDHNLPICTPVEVFTGGDSDEEEPQTELVPDPKTNSAAEDKFQTIMMNLTEGTWRRLAEQVKQDAALSAEDDSGMDES